MGESVRLAGVQVVKPQVPVAAVELTVSQPLAVRDADGYLASSIPRYRMFPD